MKDSTSFTVEIPQDKGFIYILLLLGQEVIGSFGNDYKLLASCLDIRDNNLIVKNPAKENNSNVNESSYL